jgi:hypothetical protein
LTTIFIYTQEEDSNESEYYGEEDEDEHGRDEDEGLITRVTKPEVTECLEIAHTPYSLTSLFIYTQVGDGDTRTTTHPVHGSAPEDSDDDTSPVAEKFQRYKKPYVKPLAAAKVKTPEKAKVLEFSGRSSSEQAARNGSEGLRRSTRGITKALHTLCESGSSREKRKRDKVNVKLNMVNKGLFISPTEDNNEPMIIKYDIGDAKDHIGLDACITKVVDGNFYHAYIYIYHAYTLN